MIVPGEIQVRLCTHHSDHQSLKRAPAGGSHPMNFWPGPRAAESRVDGPDESEDAVRMEAGGEWS
jgi:hypothetical protein